MAAGLVQELAALREKYALGPSLPSMRCVGYRQAWEHLEGAYDRATLRERGIYATRQLAKRQLTCGCAGCRSRKFSTVLLPTWVSR